MKGKVIVITGGSSGIGKALAEKFAAEGSNVLITGRNLQELEEVRNHLRQAGHDIQAFAGDVGLREANEKMAEYAIQQFGRIDVLINNAGISMRSLFKDLELEVIEKVMQINFFGSVYATKSCLPEIMKNKGSVIGISSIAGFRGLPGRTGYSASKFALNGFLEALRTELLDSGVHIMTVAPGFTASNIRKRALTADGSPQAESPREENKMMSAEECAAIIYRATVARKHEVIMTTQGKLTVFLNKWFSKGMDRLVFKEFAKETNSPF